ncbi:hypothetical protein KOR34_35990 [Posidoniimonas corsicana]|uniref:Uncharacterized protein n=1 Tax=Posidoniimonas corsicana TaxID=1938618 RepID=A0A5C5V7M9_9BACT|nr:hypothetical protein KOR34_35990 [Posidoniimonas corsicana]
MTDRSYGEADARAQVDATLRGLPEPWSEESSPSLSMAIYGTECSIE